jgi:hypothetical protein
MHQVFVHQLAVSHFYIHLISNFDLLTYQPIFINRSSALLQLFFSIVNLKYPLSFFIISNTFLQDYYILMKIID